MALCPYASFYLYTFNGLITVETLNNGYIGYRDIYPFERVCPFSEVAIKLYCIDSPMCKCQQIYYRSSCLGQQEKSVGYRVHRLLLFNRQLEGNDFCINHHCSRACLPSVVQDTLLCNMAKFIKTKAHASGQ